MIRYLLIVLALGLSGCVSTVVGTTAKVGAKAVGATARAVIPGDSKDGEKSED
jgi:uncharacterized protein YceK